MNVPWNYYHLHSTKSFLVSFFLVCFLFQALLIWWIEWLVFDHSNRKAIGVLHALLDRQVRHERDWNDIFRSKGVNQEERLLPFSIPLPNSSNKWKVGQRTVLSRIGTAISFRPSPTEVEHLQKCFLDARSISLFGILAQKKPKLNFISKTSSNVSGHFLSMHSFLNCFLLYCKTVF